jgi:hypothetical protein
MLLTPKGVNAWHPIGEFAMGDIFSFIDSGRLVCDQSPQL